MPKLNNPRTKGTQKIFFIGSQIVTIPVPGNKMLKSALVAVFTIKDSIPIPPAVLIQSGYSCESHGYLPKICRDRLTIPMLRATWGPLIEPFCGS
jgi:hypothetical protein